MQNKKQLPSSEFTKHTPRTEKQSTWQLQMQMTVQRM